MSKAAEILKRLYDNGKITKSGIAQAVIDRVITPNEGSQIIGK